MTVHDTQEQVLGTGKRVRYDSISVLEAEAGYANSKK